ncbi:MAG: glycosyltransferase family 92 protein [Pseudomonadota bacterium]
MKNEGLYLKEWLEFHKMVGVEHFYLYDNDSSDETADVVRPYSLKNEATLHHWPSHPLQLKAYMHCLNAYRSESFWIAFIDLDEFIVPVATETIVGFLKDFEEFGGVGVNWLLYGNSGHTKKPAGLQIENYTYRSKKNLPSNCHIKSIINPGKVKSPKDPHCFRYLPEAYAVTENKMKINGSLTEAHSSHKIRINHFFTRSTEESRIKMERGNPDSKFKRSWDDFERLNRNDVLDRSMEKYLPELKQRVFGETQQPMHLSFLAE